LLPTLALIVPRVAEAAIVDIAVDSPLTTEWLISQK